MTEPNAAIVEQYAEHLSGKAASSVLSFGLVGAVGGAALGAIPGHLSHSLIANGVNYFAVLLGALAGGIAGRSLGDKRATGLRLQAQLALRQLQVEELLLHRAPAPAAAVPPLSAPAVAPIPALVPPLASPAVPAPAPPAPVFAPPPPPEPMVVPTVAFPLRPAGATEPPVVAPAPAPLAAAPALPVAPPPPPPVRAVPAGPQLVEQEPAMPPLSY
jgi:hypothetical protein